MQEASQILMARQGIGVPAGGKLTIMRGDIVRVHASFDYRGPAGTLWFRASIGQTRMFVYDEIAMNRKAVYMPASADYVSYSEDIDIDSSPVGPAIGLHVRAEFEEHPDAKETIEGVIDCLGAAEFRDFAITEYEIVG